MPDYVLTATAAVEPSVDIGEMVLRETPLALASVAAFDHAEAAGQAGDRLARHLGQTLPGVQRFAGTGESLCFWTGDQQWFVTAPIAQEHVLAAQLSEALAEAAAVTDQTGGWVALDVEGPALTAVFERLVGFDVAAMQTGDALRATIEHIGCFVLCLSEDRHMRLFCARSFAEALHHALCVAMKTAAAQAGQVPG
ncbi:sarcosine oxidase subunit gamma family protein [Cognatishimia sp. SS12]|uniref:sarcosine oxidase subunit gamma n=1 Tax=Cognatishimia sp. SS12 TaxID=2979465 RepID=UPI002331586E|nr:sarcosine oxidase subunit gamma family protein [Cognatishimia sp. SS12]MDC0739536.1 sarcosine oxidase subunit gamma family protein [Cognatishimia sp. SS12]